MIALKPGVSLKLLKPQTALMAQIVDGCYEAHGQKVCTITSGSDGTHSPQSLHYVGLALDFRTRGVSDLEGLKNKIKVALGFEFDVILESDHFHIEYDIA